jgi:hypothetical protein
VNAVTESEVRVGIPGDVQPVRVVKLVAIVVGGQ